jgi:uncharacterized protein YfaS (alpha-2-macroglobulin family)
MVLAAFAVLGSKETATMAEDDRPGLRFQLGEGGEPAAAAETTRLAPHAEPLDPASTQRVLDRLPPIKEDARDRGDFALRESSLPPPRTGATLRDAFPPAAAREAPEPSSGPLTVLRFAPEGDVPLVPDLSVTFSQPMVAVTSHGELDAQAVPVRLSPQPPGRWEWIGTRTLLFRPEGRFPMATAYHAEVAAGTKSASGGVLAQAARWAFTTPAPQVVAQWPENRPARREAVMVAAFDQRVSPQAVLPTIVVRANDGVRAVRLATGEELAADADAQRVTARSEAGRWVAFRAVEPLPTDAAIAVTVGPATPSAEGPRTTAQGHTWRFRTYGFFKVMAHRCGWRDECPPFAPWQIQMSNPVDAKAFRQDMVRVEPRVPGLKVDVYGENLSLHGLTKGRTTYTITLAAGLPDAFGQSLGRDTPLQITVGPAAPSLTASGQGMVVLDPAAPKRFSVYTVNQPSVRVRAYAVSPEDWPGYLAFLEARQRADKTVEPPGHIVMSRDLAVHGAPDELTEVPIDLSPALPGGLGQIVLLVDPSVAPRNGGRSRVELWIQATRIGLDAFVDQESLVGWATSLADGRPLEGATLQIGAQTSATTDAAGLARLALPAQGVLTLVARHGKDVALLPASTGWWDKTGWQHRAVADSLRWLVFDDRHLYKPGEEVRIKGWIRRIGGGTRGDVEALAGVARSVHYRVQDSQGNQVAQGDGEIDRAGGLSVRFTLPPAMNLGPAQVVFNVTAAGLEAAQYHHAFEVQEFRRPEFEVTAVAGPGPHLVGTSTTVTATASYYAGGGLADAEVTWSVSSQPAVYAPPNHDDFAFGTWTPWWGAPIRRDPEQTTSYAARTDASGRHHLRIDLQSANPPRPSTLRAEATVADVNRQAWTAGAQLLVHPASVYVGLRSPRVFVQQGEAVRVDAIVTDIDGAVVADRPVSVRAERVDWQQVQGEWKETTADPQDCSLTSGREPGTCTFRSGEGGVLRLTATVTDDRGRRNETQIRVWVAGGKVRPRRDVAQEAVQLVPNKKTYAAGETAEVLVLAPFAPAEGVMSLRRSGLVRTESFHMSGGSHTLRVPIEEGFTPNVVVQVDLVGAAPRTDDAGVAQSGLPPRPAFATGEINLSVPPRQRTLSVAAAPREAALEPGTTTSVDVVVKDAAGAPVSGGQVAVVVVDEAVLSVADYRIPDPLDVFYAARSADVRDHHLRQNVVLGRPEDAVPEDTVALDAIAPAGRGMYAGAPPPAPAPQRMRLEAKAMAAGAPEPIRLRTDFNALALFAASLPTDAQGRASVELKVPDNLTRYRITAVAVAGARDFGKGESTLTARLPLMARLSPPRFLNFGDRFELPVVVQNQTDRAVQADVAVRASNLRITAGAGRRVEVPAHDRVEVRFAAEAEQAGTARVQAGAIAGQWADASEVRLPVWTPATTEAFATYGVLDQGAMAQPVKAPQGVFKQFGGLEITTSATALQALTDAVLYLVAYPFECAEQLSSRVLGVAALKDVLTAFRAEGLPSPEAMREAVGRDLERLAAMQNPDGGFGFWRRGEEAWPYVSIHVAHALARAQDKGFAVPKEMLQRSRSYLAAIDKHIPKDYGPELRHTLTAYALSVRARLGDRDPAAARRLVAEAGVGGLSFEALGWVLPVLSGDAGSAAEVAAIRRRLAANVAESAGTAHFAVSYGDGAHLLLYSDRRADAVLLEALIADQPKSDLIPKLVEGLLGHRRQGRWENTQENVFVLLALDRYFNTYEKTTPDFVARLWLGERYAGENAFRGRTTERHQLEIPMAALAASGAAQDVVLSKEGAGRLYYRIGMRYAPADLDLAASDHGFTVERTYEAIDSKDDVSRAPDGAWRVKAGARVRVRLSLVTQARRYHVALVDPLPAGLEAVNPALATSGTLPKAAGDTVGVIGAPGFGDRAGGHWWRWWRPWFDHQNLRDERVEAFAALLFEGVYSYSYVARATTPGRFVVPPPRAEEMYHPETFGRGRTDRVLVE